jgi:hypothetical protein
MEALEVIEKDAHNAELWIKTSDEAFVNALVVPVIVTWC